MSVIGKFDEQLSKLDEDHRTQFLVGANLIEVIAPRLYGTTEEKEQMLQMVIAVAAQVNKRG